MRNLKKTLCLVLALVFVLGLCTVGANSDKLARFSDAETIQYVNQVNAMTGLGILEGYPDGSFKPAQNVTRAEAAKIISYVMVGTDEVEKWPAKQVFDDVPADHWAAKYITFCEYNNVINGYGNGKFGPNDPVTKAQLAKMLLAACGYGQKDEFIGEGWDQNVAALAFECKVLKDIKGTADWNSPASREETALMCYNTMMRTYRVVLSDDTTSYEPAWINGRFNVTFAQSPWGLQDVTGIVYNNKANTKGAKGTYLNGILYETDVDDDASVLGHKITIMYRVEGVTPNQKNVAYYVEDLCRDVSGVEANYKELAANPVTVEKGFVTNGFKATVDKYTRHLDFTWLYILDEDNIVIGCKSQDTFTIVPISVNPYNGVASVLPIDENGKMYDSEEVALPEGVKNGDLVCLFQCGDVFSVKPTYKTENVDIFHKEMNVAAVQYWTYNDGAVRPTAAGNVTRINLASLTCMNPQELTVLSTDTATGIKKYEPVLKVGYTYTLYFDCEGGCFAYGDERPTTERVASYAMFVAEGVTHDHTWDCVDVNYIQVLWLDGRIEKILVAEPTGLTKGDIVTIWTPGYFSTVTHVTQNVLERATLPSMTNNPEYDYSSATFCYHNNGEKAGLYYLGSTARPLAGTQVSMVYKVVKIGTVYVRIVTGVWFYEASPDASPYGTTSFIYVINDDIQYQRLINGQTRNFYNGMKDGEALTDLRITPDNIANPQIGAYIGFNQYFVDTNGDYHLQKLPVSKGEKTGERNIYLVDADSLPKDIPSNNYCFILNGKLWAMDETTGMRNGMDLTDVKFVRLVGYTWADMLAGFVPGYVIPLDSVAAVQQLLLTQFKDESTKTAYTAKLDVSFVEQLTPAGHVIGGKTIYITGIEIATETSYAPAE